MKEMQKFTKEFQQGMGWDINRESYSETRTSLLGNYMLLTTEVAEVAEELRKAFNRTRHLVDEGMEEGAAFQLASEEIKEDIGKELADCLAYMLKFANFFEIDLAESFYAKMEEVKNRKNRDAVTAVANSSEERK